ncbi:protein-tyrosine phosphatase-like protein [Mycotypha africana]|uniref:protein-tyrosine phosphatase-like protein n=1 Tax=Mycotypha africana TaxID=64632 RepID=UPI002300706A|nr:protein-tyrosine phosphatase-like protein [Mycotypha africana]KAI8991912.1 protein-tyrosine phosphatase-like protein [Mycotypha africana]
MTFSKDSALPLVDIFATIGFNNHNILYSSAVLLGIPRNTMNIQPNRIDLLRITQRKEALIEEDKETKTTIGTLHLTIHHLIFNYSEDEIWIPYSIVHIVERQPPSFQTGRYPIQIKCRDFSVITLSFLKDGDALDVYESIQRLACVSSIDQLYAFSYQPREPFTTNDGWNIYDPIKEYERMGVDVSTDQWRFSLINRDYKYSPTYPRVLVVPAKISDTTLNYAAKYRSKARIPALSYVHWYNSATITRSSQPLVGFKQARSVQDEKLIEAIFSSNVPTGPNGETLYGSTAANLIIDARPMANAVGNVARGAGTENMDHYRNCKKVYVAIDNIHVMRDSLTKLTEGWLRHIALILDGALTIVKNVHVYNSHVLVHCSDGWDRTTQLVALSELCLDPFYRTFEGFQILIEKDWVSFGHKFQDRCGHLTNDPKFTQQKETSPVFHQFLECIYQLLCLYPTRFEFTEAFLIELHYHLYACQFGTFLFNSESDRRGSSIHAQSKTYSIWDYFNTYKHEKGFINECYDPMKDKDLVDDGGVLMPDPTKYIKVNG